MGHMKKILKSILAKVFGEKYYALEACRTLVFNRKSYLYETGWMPSFVGEKPVDADGKPIPWMNYAIIDFLDERLKRDFSLFEFGSGYSTSFYAGRVGRVVSVEYDRNWYELVKKQVPENVEVIFKEKDIDGDYCRTVLAAGDEYDVIVVDGRDRCNCLKQSILALKSGGVLVLDDSQRDRYRECFEYAKANGFKVLSMSGIKATGNKKVTTTIFYRDGNCLGI